MGKRHENKELEKSMTENQADRDYQKRIKSYLRGNEDSLSPSERQSVERALAEEGVSKEIAAEFVQQADQDDAGAGTTPEPSTGPLARGRDLAGRKIEKPFSVGGPRERGGERDSGGYQRKKLHDPKRNGQ